MTKPTRDDTTSPRPFVFVLMPFDECFDDTYEQIKRAANEAGMYAERADEHDKPGDILDRIRNSINRADIIVADATDANANVYYEIGYAHALGKPVLLLAQSGTKLLFDLTHDHCVFYDIGKTHRIGERLLRSLPEVLETSVRQRRQLRPAPLIAFNGQLLAPLGVTNGKDPVKNSVRLTPAQFISFGPNDTSGIGELQLDIVNPSARASEPVPVLYLLTKLGCTIEPLPEDSNFDDLGYEPGQSLRPARLLEPVDGYEQVYRLPCQLSALPPQATETLLIPFSAREPDVWEPMRLRLFSRGQYIEYDLSCMVEDEHDPPDS